METETFVKLNLQWIDEQTGGGCRAWALYRPNDLGHPVAKMLVTAENGADLPGPFDAAFVLGCYDSDGDEISVHTLTRSEAKEMACRVVNEWVERLCQSTFR
jgi:hypothetical protein